jgi:hypothetical protein
MDALCVISRTINFSETTYDTASITVAARCKARTVVGRSSTGIVGSSPTQRTDNCLRRCSVYVLGVLPAVYRLRNLKSGQDPQVL